MKAHPLFHHAGICYLVPMVARICWLILFLSVSYASAQDRAITVQSITVEGNKAFDSLRIKNGFRNCREGGIFQLDGLTQDLASLSGLYQDEGYIKATVGPPLVTFQDLLGKGKVAAIRVPISEGPLFTVGEIAVKDVRAFRPETLLRMCPLKTGLPYSRKKLAEWVDKIEDGYHTMGYIRFTAGFKEDVHELRRVIDCTLECKEGNAYSVGKIVIEGDDSIDRSDLKRHLLLGEGGLYNPEMINLSILFLNQMGKYRPISDKDVDVKIDDATSTVDIILRIAIRQKQSIGHIQMRLGTPDGGQR